MIYNVSKKLLTLSLLAFVLIATTFTLAKGNEKNDGWDDHWTRDW